MSDLRRGDESPKAELLAGRLTAGVVLLGSAARLARGRALPGVRS